MNISFYNKVNDRRPSRTLTIDQFLKDIKDEKYFDLITRIRNAKGKDRKALKPKILPGVTLSALFEGNKTDATIKAHSGFICIDIDNIQDPNEIKEELAADECVYSVFTSCSGRGVAAIFKIDGNRHREAFYGISNYLYEKYGFISDTSCVNPSRFRFVSSDADIYINTDAIDSPFYESLKEENTYQGDEIIDSKQIEKLVSDLEAHQINLTEEYGSWVKVCYSLISELGKDARGLFHRISKIDPRYNETECNRLFSGCLRSRKGANDNGCTIGTFLWYCKQYNLVVNDNQRDEFNSFDEEPVFERIDAKNVNKNRKDNRQKITPLLIVENFFSSKNIRRNEVTKFCENEHGDQLEETDINTFYIDCKKRKSTVSKSLVTDYLFSHYTKSYNPFIDFFDKVEPVNPVNDDLIEKLFWSLNPQIRKTEHEPCLSLFKKWLLQIYASVYRAGDLDLMLILIGGKNCGKTYFFDHLLPKPLRKNYYSRISNFPTNEADAKAQVCENLLLFRDELTPLSSGKNSSFQKYILSGTHETYRAPYGKGSLKREKYAVCCGAGNDYQILPNDGSNRRYFAISINKRDKEVYDQIVEDTSFRLWGQLKFIWESVPKSKRRDLYRISDEEIEYLSELGQFKEPDVIGDIILRHFKKSEGRANYITAGEAYAHLPSNIHSKVNINQFGKHINSAFPDCRIRKKIGGKVKTVYLLDRLQDSVTMDMSSRPDLNEPTLAVV